MNRKIFFLLGVFIVLVFMQSCSSDPDKGLLEKYFQADSLNDNATLSTMALAPISIDPDSYEILSKTEEMIESASLPDLNAKYLDLKKKLDDSIQVTLESSGLLDDAKFEMETARTPAAARAAKTKVDAAQLKYDEQYEKHKDLQKGKNEAEAAANREEEITLFSLGVQELVNVRDLTGEVAFKEVTVRTVGDEGTKDYKFYLRRYTLIDEAMNTNWRGHWKIIKIEPLD